MGAVADDRQVEPGTAYGRHLDTLPPTCSPETKMERFRNWLRARGVDYPG